MAAVNLMDQPPPLPNPQSAAAPRPPMSLLARLLNIFAIPGEVFEDVKHARLSIGNWLVPILLAAVIGATTASLIFSQPTVVPEMRDKQIKSTNELVAAGKMTRADADQMIKLVEWVTQPAILKTASAIAAVVISVLRVFWWAFILWVLGIVFLKRRFSYLKSAEVAGLATLISVLGEVVMLLLTFGFGEPGANGGLTLTQLAAKQQMPVRLILANIFSIWLVGLMAAGLAHLAEVRFSRTFLLVLGYWILFQMGLALTGAAMIGAMK
jgi:hypothetical protein